MKAEINDADLDRLDVLLSTPARAANSLGLDALQGLLCAVVNGPQPVMPSRWIPEALGEENVFPAEEESDEIFGLLMAFHNDVARQLNAQAGFNFVQYGDEGSEDARTSIELWCEGYLMGVMLADPSWESQCSPEDLDDLLFPFYALSGQWKEGVIERGEAWMSAKEERKMLDAFAEDLANEVLEVRRFWFEMGYPETVRRTSPKVGRNDPCPCGSGKKHKNCCGKGA